MQPDVVARFLITAFCAVVFIQSAIDKLVDRDGNIGYFTSHFKSSPVPPAAVPLLFWMLTLIEGTAGVLCALGLLLGDFLATGMSVSACGVSMGGVALLCLLVGQRVAKDYAGAAVVAAYFAVVLIGLRFF